MPLPAVFRSAVLATALVALAAAPAAAEPPLEGEGAPAEAAAAPAADGAGPASVEAPAPQTALDPALDDDPFFLDEYSPGSDSAARDPWEPFNRSVFSFNRGVDRWVFDPVTRGYQLVVPEPGRRALERAFLNLDAPVIAANQILQLRVADAAGTIGRFVVNSSFGVGGMWDPATTSFALRRTAGDFGQTLARYGTPSGPYLMLPLFGPSTARDAFGDVVDVASDPFTYLAGPLQWWTLALGGSEGLVLRESRIGQLEALEAGSVDFYSALRSAYLQSRDAQVRGVRGEPALADVVMRAD